jgi:hypothetical protein
MYMRISGKMDFPSFFQKKKFAQSFEWARSRTVTLLQTVVVTPFFMFWIIFIFLLPLPLQVLLPLPVQNLI